MTNAEIRARKRKDTSLYIKTSRMITDNLSSYMRTHGAIKPSLMRYCEYIGIDPTTFHRHFANLDDVIAQAKMHLSNGITEILTRVSDKNLPRGAIFRNVLIYLYKNQPVAELVLVLQDYKFMTEQLDRLKPVLTYDWDSYYTIVDGNVYMIYRQEVFAVIMNWCNDEHFNPSMLEEKARHLTYLTRTAPERLGPLET